MVTRWNNSMCGAWLIRACALLLWYQAQASNVAEIICSMDNQTILCVLTFVLCLYNLDYTFLSLQTDVYSLPLWILDCGIIWLYDLKTFVLPWYNFLWILWEIWKVIWPSNCQRLNKKIAESTQRDSKILSTYFV